MNIDWNLLIEECKIEIHSLGYEWIDFIQSGVQKKPVLKFFIDKRDTGFTIDDATFLTKKFVHWFSTRLPKETNFQIEVSSPGIERPISEIWQFQKHIGRMISIQFEEHAKLKDILGKLISVNSEELSLEINKKVLKIPFQSIKKGKVLVSTMLDRNKGKRR